MSSSPALETSTPSSPGVHQQTFVYGGHVTYQHQGGTREERPPREHSAGKSNSVPRQTQPLQVWLPATSTPTGPLSYPSTPPSHCYSVGVSQGDTITPPPHSPAALSWTGGAGGQVPLHSTTEDTSPKGGNHHSHHPDGTSSDKSSETAVVGVSEGGAATAGGSLAPTNRLSRKESYKAQRQHYRKEKKRAASALLSSLEDPSVVILADWLKVRGSLKSWTKLWCILKPGLLLLYKNPKAKSSHWVGTVLVSSCQAIERPSKKDGFCFKLYHPLDQNIWAPRGPHNETIGAVVQPLPTSHLIFRAPSQAAGKCWMDGLELALRNTANHTVSGNNTWIAQNVLAMPGSGMSSADHTGGSPHPMASHETQWSREDLEKHFNDHDLEGADLSESDTDGSGVGRGRRSSAPPAALADIGALVGQDVVAKAAAIRELWSITYVEEASDDVGQAGEQVEELAEENKSLLWFLIKQVRPGMDLSKVVLPTFILEPRSFLDRLADNYYHSDMLSRASTLDDSYERFRAVLSWYLSGLYKKPRGLKKPYNPVLGEVYRCCWPHPETGSATYYIAEQVSHHPPVSAFYVSNRKDGFVVEGAIMAKSKFYGNSTSAILEGAAKLTLLDHKESYIMTTPYAHCKGIVLGTLSMELGGKVIVECESTGYKADLEFKLKSYFGGSDQINAVTGRIKKNKEVIATIDGYWDGRIDLKDKRTGKETPIVEVNVLKKHRLRRHLMAIQHQEQNESQRLWVGVSRAIAEEDQIAATEEKTKIEEAQRKRARSMKDDVYEPRLFRRSTSVLLQPSSTSLAVQSTDGQHWEYRHPNLRPWDKSSDLLEYEQDFIMQTLRYTSCITDSPAPLAERRIRQGHINRHQSITDTDSSHENIARSSKVTSATNQVLKQLESSIKDLSEQVMDMKRSLDRIEQIQSGRRRNTAAGNRILSEGAVTEMFYAIVVALLLQSLLSWMYNKL